MCRSLVRLLGDLAVEEGADGGRAGVCTGRVVNPVLACPVDLVLGVHVSVDRCPEPALGSLNEALGARAAQEVCNGAEPALHALNV